MNTTNPYSTPESDLSTADNRQYYHPDIFQLRGRIGRLRYLAYTFTSYFLFMILFGILLILFSGLLPALSSYDLSDGFFNGVWLMILLLYSPLIFVSFVITIRRLNDLNLSGIYSLVPFLPFVGSIFILYIIFARGTTGPNKYGPEPDENPTWVKITGIGFPVLILSVFVISS